MVATSKTESPAKRSVTSPVKTATKPAARRTKAHSFVVGTEQRRRYIEVAAYYLAERRGFQGGDETSDWLTAEAEIDRLLAESGFNA
jgi:hypothetical protein